MSGLVVDASVVIAWLFDDEDDPRADKALEELEREGAIVPQLWHLETRNSLLTAERRGRLTAEEVKERLDALKGLPIATDEQPELQSAFDLARIHKQSLYDAVYLELAKREDAALATLDSALARAATLGGCSYSLSRRWGSPYQRLDIQQDRRG